MRLDVTFNLSPALERLAQRFVTFLERNIMATIDDLVTEMEGTTGKVASLEVFVKGLEDQLAAILSGAQLPPAVQEKVDKMFADARVNNRRIAHAIDSDPSTTGQDDTGTGGTDPNPPGDGGGETPPGDGGGEPTSRSFRR